MASFTSDYRMYLGGTSSKEALLVRGTLKLNFGEGGTSGDIPASLFGLNKLLSVVPAIKSDDSEVAFFAVSKDSDELFVINIKDSTDLRRADPTSLPGSWVITVIGQ